MGAMLSAYNYFASEYGKFTKASRYDSHKKDELRLHYNNVIKQNSESPLYMFKMSDEITDFAVSLKEDARNIKNTLSAISDLSGDELSDKVAFASNPDVLDVSFIKEEAGDQVPQLLELNIKELAKPQINMSKSMRGLDSVPFAAGSHSFFVDINNMNYEFQFSINSEDNNKSVMEKIEKLINKSNIGLNAELTTDDSSSYMLEISSVKTGKAQNGQALFNIYDKDDTIANFFGLGNIARESTNSSFTLNGSERSSYSNTFTISKCFEVTLKAPTPDEPVTIRFKDNVEGALDNVGILADSYNHLVELTDKFKNSSVCNPKLFNDISKLSLNNKEVLDSIGMKVEANGTISVDRNLLHDAVTDESRSAFTAKVLERFKSALSTQAEKISLNPMEYANKTLVAYKNPNNHNLQAPYVTSIYSGMMFNNYC